MGNQLAARILGQQQECFFGVSRRRAEGILMRPDVKHGQYILRPSTEKRKKCIAMSVKNGEGNTARIENFKIFLTAENECYIQRSISPFATLDGLIQHYQKNGLPKGREKGDLRLSQPLTRNMPPPQLSEITIQKSKLTKLAKLGEGQYGEVFKGKFGILEVAVKQLQRDESDQHGKAYQFDGDSDSFGREAKILASLFHENLVRLIAVCTESQPFWIVTEFMNKGSLYGFLRDDKEAQAIELSDVLRILVEVADGMTYLEINRIVHCDLRAANVLIHMEKAGDAFEVKVADFGLTKVLVDDKTYSRDKDAAFPFRWAAPEVIKGGRYSSKSDVWSFGVLAYEVVTLGEKPYPKIASNKGVVQFIQNGNRMTHDDCREAKRNVMPSSEAGGDPYSNTYYTSGGVEINASDLCPANLYTEIMLPCWETNPDARPSFAELRQKLMQAKCDVL